MRNKPPKRRGDRRDAYLVRNADPMHSIMSRVLGERTCNEAVMTVSLDLTEAEAYLAALNRETEPENRYTMFHLLCAAVGKTIALRPKMNYFMKARKLYEREDISLAFIAKSKFSDDGGESLVILKLDESDDAASPLKQVHDRICGEVRRIRKENAVDGSTDLMNRLVALPGFLLDAVVWVLRRMDQRGHLPAAVSSVNPYEASVFISNLGSIQMDAKYHHLANFGTNSFFIIIGKKEIAPRWREDGSFEMRMTLPLGITVDERIGDGYYFGKSIRLLQYLMAHPACLDEPLYTKPDWED